MYLCVRSIKPGKWVVMYLCVRSIKPGMWAVMYLFLRSIKPGKWAVMYLCVRSIKPGKWAVMYLCVRSIDFVSIWDLFIGFRNSSVNEVIFVFHLLHPSHHKYKLCIWFVVRNQQLPLPVSLYRVAEKPDSVSSHNIHSFNWKDYALYDFTYNCQHWTWSIGFKT
jgi:uncharacterized membrane protein YpjA